MKHRIGAAAVAVGMIFAPGALLAGTQEQSCTVASFDATTGVLAGVGRTEILRHGSSTLHVTIGDPNLIPSDSCRAIAQAWNLAVYEGLAIGFYNELLSESAESACRFEYVRSDVADADGAYALIAMRPAK